jgi:hypothetical protein
MLKSQFSPFSAAPQLTLGARLTSPDTHGAGHELGRVAAGLGFAAVYGLALGVRGGGASLLQHAFGAAFGLAAIGILAVPSLFVLLALVDAPVSPSAILSASARALASTGFVLAGLAPSAALLGVTIESRSAAAFIAAAGFGLAGGIGLARFVSSARELLGDVPSALRIKCNILLCAFAVFAVALAERIWQALPVLKGGA